MPNLIGSMNLDGTLKGIISGGSTFTGKLANATLRGYTVELQIDGTVLQYRHEDEDDWHDLIDLNNIDYEALNNLPTLNGNLLIGELSELFMLPADEITAQELNAILNE